jgi:tetratricopeptide (TPR) repeat protein
MQWNTLFPFQEDAALGLIRVLNKSRRFETAAAVATDFLKSESNDQIAVARAHFLALTGRLQETKEVYTGLPQELKTTPFVRGINARIALFEKRPKEAIDDAQAAYDQIKNYDNLNLVTQVLTSAKQRDTAIAVLEQHVDELQNDVLAIMLLAEYKFSEEPEAAMTLYKRAIELLPDNAVALNNVAYLHKQKGEIEIARDYAEKAYAIFPANPGIADTYAQVLLTMGEVDEAVKTYEYLLSASNAAEFIQLNYVEALLVQGEKELAKRKLKGMKFSTPASFLTLEKLSKEYELDI